MVWKYVMKYHRWIITTLIALIAVITPFVIYFMEQTNSNLVTQNKFSTQGPINGVFIAAKTMQFDGTITGPNVQILSDNYSGKGKVVATGINPVTLNKWWENTYVQILVLLGALAGIFGLFWILK